MNDRPVEPYSSSELPEQWADISFWEKERADALIVVKNSMENECSNLKIKIAAQEEALSLCLDRIEMALKLFEERPDLSRSYIQNAKTILDKTVPLGKIRTPKKLKHFRDTF